MGHFCVVNEKMDGCLTEDGIENFWNLEDWNEKLWNLEG